MLPDGGRDRVLGVGHELPDDRLAGLHPDHEIGAGRVGVVGVRKHGRGAEERDQGKDKELLHVRILM